MFHVEQSIMNARGGINTGKFVCSVLVSVFGAVHS